MTEKTKTFRETVEEHCVERKFAYYAYMSSALTSLSGSERHTLERLLEDLYTAVFLEQDVFLYLPHLFSNPGHDDGMTPRAVHMLDRLRISQSNFLVLCADHPSFGVGQEFEIAQMLGLRVLMFRKKSEKPLSRMLLGGPARHAQDGENLDAERPAIIEYSSPEELIEIMSGWVGDLLPLLKLRRTAPAFSDNLRAELRGRISTPEQRLDVANRVGITPAYLEYLLTDQATLVDLLNSNELPDLGLGIDISKYVNPGVWLVHQLCAALGLKFSRVTGLGEAAQTEEGEIVLFPEAVREVCEEQNATAREYFQLVASTRLRALAARKPTKKDMKADCKSALAQLRAGKG